MISPVTLLHSLKSTRPCLQASIRTQRGSCEDDHAAEIWWSRGAAALVGMELLAN